MIETWGRFSASRFARAKCTAQFNRTFVSSDWFWRGTRLKNNEKPPIRKEEKNSVIQSLAYSAPISLNIFLLMIQAAIADPRFEFHMGVAKCTVRRHNKTGQFTAVHTYHVALHVEWSALSGTVATLWHKKKYQHGTMEALASCKIISTTCFYHLFSITCFFLSFSLSITLFLSLSLYHFVSLCITLFLSFSLSLFLSFSLSLPLYFFLPFSVSLILCL